MISKIIYKNICFLQRNNLKLFKKKRCDESCRECSKSHICTACPEGKYLSGVSCLSSCEVSEFYDPIDQRCKAC